MAVTCQNCGDEISDRTVHDQTDLAPGQEVVTHSYEAEDGIGVITDYYCGPDCARVAFSGGGA